MPFPIDALTLEHLRGSSFSSGYRLALPKRDAAGYFSDRFRYLENACRGKRVLHLGCCDHAPLIRQKIATNCWLHSRLSQVAESCLGVDIAQEAVQLVREDWGYKNVIYADLAQGLPLEISQAKPFDLLVAGEIVEHLDNPVAFLSALRSNLQGHCSQILITVPNAFRRANLTCLFSRVEWINSDHRYWFTPFTLAKVLCQAGLVPSQFDFVENSIPRRARGLSSLFRQWLLKTHPALREVLIMEARFA